MTIATQQKVSIPIRNALAELPDAQARVFRLRAIEKRSFQEIGQEVGVFWEQAVSIYIAAVYNAKAKDIDIEALAKVVSPNRVLEKDNPEQFLKELEHSQKAEPDPSKCWQEKINKLAQLNQELKSETMATKNNRSKSNASAREAQKSKQGSQLTSENSLVELDRKIKTREAELKNQLEAIQSELAILNQDKEVIEKAIAVQIKY